MQRLFGTMLALLVAGAAVAGPIATVKKYDGKFKWVKLGTANSATTASFAKASMVDVDVRFPHDVKLKKDVRGNQWFTFILADQGSDWKWNQTTGNGGVPAPGGTIKAGLYHVDIPLAGIPKSVLQGKMQTISLGPGSSGLVGATSFTIDRIWGVSK